MLFATACVFIVCVILAVMWATQRQFIYFPTQSVPSPADLGVTDVEAVTFETDDGLLLNGWFFPAPGSSSRVTVLVFNGNAGNRAHRVPLAVALRRYDMQTLLVDYRGYGGNPGVPSERGLRLDSRAARAFVIARPDIDASRLVCFGESLGTAVAVDLAVEHPPASLILRSPFTSMVDLGRHHYPFLPVRLLLRDQFRTLDKIRHIRAPLLVIAGDRDEVVPLHNSRRVYEAAQAPKAFVVIPGADHNDAELLAGDHMIGAIVRAIRRH